MILICFLFFAPYYVFILLGVIGMFVFPKYYESVILFFLSDVIYGTKEIRYFDFVYITSIVGIVLFFIIEFTKNKLRFYK